MLSQNANKPLDTAKYYPMNHDRTVFFAVCTGIFQFKPLRHLHVQLDGTALPGPAKAVLQMEVNLRAIESAVALVNHIFSV